MLFLLELFLVTVHEIANERSNFRNCLGKYAVNKIQNMKDKKTKLSNQIATENCACQKGARISVILMW